MEIINCIQTGNYGGFRKSILRSYAPRNSSKSFRHIFLETKGRIIYGLKKIRHVKKAIPFLLKFWRIPAAAFAVTAIFYGIYAYVNYSRSFFSTVALNFPNEEKMLAVAMEDFAFSDTGYYDLEGNIFDGQGEPLSYDVSFSEPVKFTTYTVRAGDTISGISLKFSLSNISTLIAVNKIENVRALRAGQKLKIPSEDGLVHVVASGENIGSICSKYGISLQQLVDVNELESNVIKPGDSLFIPGAKLDSVTLKRAMGELFSCPIKSFYRVTDKYGQRINPVTNLPGKHTGVDLACPTGTPIKAALSGTVVYTGNSNVWGNYVIVKHIDGYQTLYAHMSKITCKKGDSVTQNSQLGLVGSTGMSTGPHLHFTVYKNGVTVDPATVVKY